jgi:hypothetical protein
VIKPLKLVGKYKQTRIAQIVYAVESPDKGNSFLIGEAQKRNISTILSPSSKQTISQSRKCDKQFYNLSSRRLAI